MKLTLWQRGAQWIARHEFWLCGVYGVPLLLASNLPPVFAAALGVIPVFWVARRFGVGAWSLPTSLDLPIALLLVMGLVGASVAVDRGVGWRVYSEFFGGVALYYSIVNGLQYRNVFNGVAVLVALGAGMGVLGILGLDHPEKFLPLSLLNDLLPNFDVSFLNPRGFTPNIVAGAIAPVIPVAGVWVATQSRWKRVLGLALVVLLTSIVVLTQSRGALLGLGAAFVIILSWRERRLLWVILGAAAILGAAVLFLGNEQLFDLLIASDSTGSTQGRLELWDRALRMFQDFPFTGIGLGTFPQVVPVLYPLFLNAPDAPQPHAHNLYLQMGVDYGVGGFIAFLALVTTTLGVGLQNARRLRATRYGWLALGLLASVVAFLGHSLLDAIFTSTKVSVGVWIVLGVMMVLARVNE